MKSLNSEFGKVVIPQDMEKYLSLTAGQLKFIESFQLTPKDLDVLVKTLADDEFGYLRESCTSNHFGLIRRKGVYPYEYRNETELPSHDAFFSKLPGSPCSDSEYAHATRVWTAFLGGRAMADHYDIYIQLDVLHLADVFEKFRTTCLEYYSLDSIHYYTTPCLAWNAALRMSYVDLKLDMYHFVLAPIVHTSPIRTIPARISSIWMRTIYMVANVSISAHSWVSFNPAR